MPLAFSLLLVYHMELIHGTSTLSCLLVLFLQTIVSQTFLFFFSWCKVCLCQLVNMFVFSRLIIV
jgi:hypothetical protein